MPEYATLEDLAAVLNALRCETQQSVAELQQALAALSQANFSQRLFGFGGRGRGASVAPSPTPTPSAAQCLYERLLFAQLEPWDAGCDPAKFFSGPDAVALAEAQAATMNPTALDPVVILIAPAVYFGTMPLELVSNVHLVAFTRRITGIAPPSINWSAGAGVNAPQAGVQEYVNIKDVFLGAPMTADTTAKTGDIGILEFDGADFPGGIAFTGRPAAGDQLNIYNSGRPDFAGDVTWTDATVTLENSIVMDVTTGGAFQPCEAQACLIFGNVTCNGGQSLTCDGCRIYSSISVPSAGNSMVAHNCTILGTVSGVAGVYIDVRQSEWSSGALIAGGAFIDRSYDTATAVVAGGANAFTFAGLGIAPYGSAGPDITYVDTAIAGNSDMAVTAVSIFGFTIVNASGPRAVRFKFNLT